MYPDSSSNGGWGAALGGHFTQGRWSAQADPEGVNLARALKTKRDFVGSKLELVRTENSTAPADANYGAGRSPALTSFARGISNFEIRTAADALSRLVVQVNVREPRPTR